jgi:hypothetical protein
VVEPLVLLEIRDDMPLQLSRSTALTLFSVCRQAERSVHYALSCPGHWAEFVAFYDREKLGPVNSLLPILKRAVGDLLITPTCESFTERNVIVEILTALVRRVRNMWKKVWLMSGSEAAFISASLGKLLEILGQPECPRIEGLIELRMDLCLCQWILRRKLIGLPEFRIASAVEHFFQSDHVKHVTLQELIGWWSGIVKEPVPRQRDAVRLSLQHSKFGESK